MLKTKNRMTYDRDYDAVFQHGRVLRGPVVDVRVWKVRPELYPRRQYSDETLRIGIMVSKKISKRAVVRNRIKRLIREVIRELLTNESVKTGYLVVVIAKPQFHADVAHGEIMKGLQRMFRQASLFM